MTSGNTPGDWTAPDSPPPVVPQPQLPEPDSPVSPRSSIVPEFQYVPTATQSTSPAASSPPSPPAPPVGVSNPAVPPVAASPYTPPAQYAPTQYAPPGQYAPTQYAPPPFSAGPYPGVPAPASAVPYSAVPYSAVPYSAVPYSAVPYSAVPYSAVPASAVPTMYYPASAPPGYPLPPGYQLAPPAPPRHSPWRWIAITVAVLIMCTVGGVGGLVGYADYTGALDTTATWQPGAASTELPPPQNAPTTEWDSWARRAADDVVEAQAKALIAGDEATFVGIADKSNTRLVGELQRRYKVLHAMGPGRWTQAITGGLKSKGDRAWTGDIKISYCFGTTSCEAVQLVVNSSWQYRDDRLVLSDLKQSESAWNGPRPWETDDLAVATGQRVVIAASKVNSWRLTEAVKSADKAALVADQFGKWQQPPSRYVIFLAGPTDWKKWYGHEQPDWAAAWAVPVSDNVTEVVVRTEVVAQRDLQTLLTHELTHVTTLAGKRNGAGRSAWWLIEGIADYATMVGKAVKDYDALVPTRAFVRGRWDGDPAVDAPTTSASLEDASGRYGVAFLAVRRISDKFGQAKMLDFWGRIVHDDASLETAATGALGQPWTTVKTDLTKFIRTSVG